VELILDLQGTQSADHGERGIGRFVTEHAMALLRRGLVRRIVLNPTLPFPGHLTIELLNSPLIGWGSATSVRRASAAPCAYHVMSLFELRPPLATVVPPYIRDQRLPLVITLYDLIPLLMPGRYLREPAAAEGYRARLEILSQADLVLAISERTRADAIEHAGVDPTRIVSIGAGVSTFFTPAEGVAQDRSALQTTLPRIERPFVLCVSGADDRKNTEALIAAFSRLPRHLRDSHQLVIACELPPQMAAVWRKRAADCGLNRAQLVLTGRTSDAVLRSLYRCAELFVFPSLYEGFGLPIAEAVACGCPAITSTASSLPEVLAWPPSTFDPIDIDAQSQLMERALADGAFRSELTAIGKSRATLHTWSEVAERTAQALQLIARKPESPAAGNRTPSRLAIVGVFPPHQGRSALNNARLAAALQQECRVDVIQPDGLDAADVAGVHSYPASDFARVMNPWSYDAIVYMTADAPPDDLIHNYPGIVWLDSRTYRRNLMSKEWMRSARMIIVEAPREAKVLSLEQEAGEWRPDVVTIRPAIPVAPFDPLEAGTVTSRAQGDPSAVMEVVSIGLPTDEWIAYLSQTMELLAAKVPAHLTVVTPPDHVGPVPSHSVVSGRMHIVQANNWATYWRILREASCAIQVDAPTAPNRVHALADCIAAGLPTISTIDPAGEFPAAAIRTVPAGADPSEMSTAVWQTLAQKQISLDMRQAAVTHARTWGYGAVARELLALIQRFSS
jgi:glycosyltransferase involved in cell wall biosynthesis